MLVVVGAEEGIFAFAHATLSRGDHAIVPPGPATSRSPVVARGAGADADSRWELRDSRLARRIPPRLRALIPPRPTRLIVVNFPHNPTGALPRSREAGTRSSPHRPATPAPGSYSDEVYRGLEDDPADRRCPPPPWIAMERGLSLGVMSKRAALRGSGSAACCGRYCYAPPSHGHAGKDWTTICSSAPSEVLALMGLRAPPPRSSSAISLIIRR